MLYFLDNVTLDNNILLDQIEKEDSYKIRFDKSVKDLTKIEKKDLINEHIDFIFTSCCTVIEGIITMDNETIILLEYLKIAPNKQKVLKSFNGEILRPNKIAK